MNGVTGDDIIMSVFKSKTVLIILLTCYGLLETSPLSLLCALILPALPISRPVLASGLTLLTFTPQLIQVEPKAIAMFVLGAICHLYYHGVPCWGESQHQCLQSVLPSRYLIFVYFFCFSFLSLSNFQPVHYSTLLALYMLLLIYSLGKTAKNYLHQVVNILCYLSIIWGCCLSIILAFQSSMPASVRLWAREDWWYYAMIILSNWVGFLLHYQKQYQDKTSKQEGSKVGEEIEMKEIQRTSNHSADSINVYLRPASRNDENLSEGESRHHSRRNVLPAIPQELGIKLRENNALGESEDMDLRKHRLLAKSEGPSYLNLQIQELDERIRLKSERRSERARRAWESKSGNEVEGEQEQRQQQITNLFLLIPFTLFGPVWLHIPVYFYLIWLQTGRTPLVVFHLMFVSLCLITLLNTWSPLWMQILLRVCLILIVNKNLKWAINITRVLRSIWLRSSFVFVLLILFWFSLLTVNLFHISFVLIVLLFIARNNSQNPHEPSFRHRNWKYLMVLFNTFLLLRLLWLICQQDIQVVLPAKTHDILSIFGITYDYGLAWQCFNLIPLTVSGVLTVQYWTYSSRIYDLESKQTLNFLPTYRALVLRVVEILTIFYYKLIPWLSHFIVILIIVWLEFSLIADLMLFWSLSILLVHMIMPNELGAYRKMYRMWNVFLKLVSVQIVLRYVFEFIKFPLIYTHISQFPMINTLISYQQLLGLAIRESEISYVKNIFTKFQLMMILDFSIIAIAFLTIEYYGIMIKYYEAEPSRPSGNQDCAQSQTTTNHDAIFIFENYIDFKLTKWLQNFNELILGFSKMYLKAYFPMLGTFSCLYYSLTTMMYFLFCVYYYLKINLKYYQIYALKQVQQRIMKLFHLWRLKNNIRVNLVEKDPIKTDHILLQSKPPQQQGNKNDPDSFHGEKDDDLAKGVPPSTANPWSLYNELKKQITVTNFRLLFDNFIGLHIQLRFWLLLITMASILLNYTSRLLLSKQINDFLQLDTVESLRYLLFMLGTSTESPISINMYLAVVALTVIEIKCCSLANKIGRGFSSVDSEAPPESGEVRKEQSDQVNEPQTRQIQKIIDISISLRFGFNKIMERFFVTLLVFVSLLQNVNPFSIIYLMCAWFLNYMGSKSIQGLSWTLAFLLVIQYSLILSDTTNEAVGAADIFPRHLHHSWVIEVFGIGDPEWTSYLTFGDRLSQIFVMYLSLAILMLYQFCFYLEEHNWLQILDKMFQQISLGGVYLKFYQKISQIYEYALVYSPLFIITLCLGLYLMDFTATNMFLSILSILFLFKSFLLENYTNSRPFWKSYFRILQLLIVIFMVVYCILSAPMYNQLCNKILCSPEEFRTKITKTILLLILQIGIDLISSHHFINAMATLENTLNETSSFYRVAISIVQNDKKIQKSFQSIKRKENIKKSIAEIREFLALYDTDQTVRFDNRRQEDNTNESWLDAIINLMPSFIDSSLIKGPEETRLFVKEQNKQFIHWLEIKNGSKLTEEAIKNINEAYINQFSQCQSLTDLKKKFSQIINRPDQPQQPAKDMTQSNNSVHMMHREKKNSFHDLSYDDLLSQGNNIRKSYIQGIMPYETEGEANPPKRLTNLSFRHEQQNQGRPSGRKSSDKKLAEQLGDVNEEEKKKILYMKIFQSVVSNWHYLTYFLMILQFIINMGVLTLPFPFLTFTLGIVHSYQAPKIVWRFAFLALLPPIFFKYALQIEVVKPSAMLQFVLIGSNNTSIIIEYLLMFFIVVQCLILKIAGLYDKSTAEVECMNIALIRNIINPDEKNKDKEQQRQGLLTLLEKSKKTSSTFFEYLFSQYECKFGYDYSTLMVTIQLVILVYIFCFYDRMAIREDLTFYKMIEYNQFTTGMVVMAFIQLGFILVDRIMTVLELTYQKWDVTLILKYAIMIVSLVYVHAMVLAFFPINSGSFNSNHYVMVFYILHIFYFLISALQVKVGINKESRGFMDRYTWYNGYIYIFYRAIPFLFEFKVFSDWTFSKTSLRLFDWIKYEEILGYIYVAKCNSLFLRGKRLGSKIEWWKKLLMGFPLLLTIILLLFGPLILFSSLNPLSSLNEITGGYLQLSLRINKTNEYPFYINTHITDIHFLDQQPDKQVERIIKTYELDEKSIQVVHLEPFSDQYWEISEGSYNKLIQEPLTSMYELTMRVKFDRNETKTTPVYILNTYTIPLERVPSFKDTLKGRGTFLVHNFVPTFMRLDNNNGLHYLTEENFEIGFHAEESKTVRKKYWVIDEGITFKIASDKYSKAIFGYSVMSFYISIILVVANYFRFLFQGSAYTIIMSDIPYADSILSICDAIYQARLRGDIYDEEILFWTLIDIIRSPDLMKAITGNYLNARIETLLSKEEQEKVETESPDQHTSGVRQRASKKDQGKKYQ